MPRHEPGHDALPVADWPMADQRAWAMACRRGDPFEPGGLAALWRPATREARSGAYARFLGWLQRAGTELAEGGGPSLLTEESVRNYLRMLRARGCASQTIAGAVQHLHGCLLALWPETDWRWLAAIGIREQRLVEPRRNKLARLVPQAALLALGCKMMETAGESGQLARTGVGDLHSALRFRDGLIIALLALRPLRRRNFLGLELGNTLQRTAEGWDIVLTGEDTKSSVKKSVSARGEPW